MTTLSYRLLQEETVCWKSTKHGESWSKWTMSWRELFILFKIMIIYRVLPFLKCQGYLSFWSLKPVLYMKLKQWYSLFLKVSHQYWYLQLLRERFFCVSHLRESIISPNVFILGIVNVNGIVLRQTQRNLEHKETYSCAGCSGSSQINTICFVLWMCKC